MSSFALLVGCAEYQDPRFSPLQAPSQDVTRLRRVLEDPKIGDFTVDTLPDEPSTVVRPRIEEFFKNRKRDDLLLLYFSCHGNLDSDMQLYFVATDTTKELPDSTGITAQWVKKQMDDSRSERIVLLLDCCYSGAFNGRRKGGSADAKEILDEQLGGSGRVVITASDTLEPAHESEFTDAVVQGLETGEADLDDDGWISAHELYQYVHGQVRQKNPKQTPTMSGDKMVGELHLAKNRYAPLPLPAALEQALTSKIAWERLWGVDGLKLLLAGDHPGGQKRAARQALTRLRDKDPDPGVQAAAREPLPRVPPRFGVVDPPPPSRWRWIALGVAFGVVLGAAPAINDRVEKFMATPDKPIACSPSTKSADGVLSLGTLLPKTGQFVNSGPALDAGVHSAIKDINDAGGVPGIAVKLDEANQRDEGNPSAATASQSTDALLAGGVDAIIGPATSAAAVKMIDKAVCTGLIMFSSSNTAPVFTTYPDHGLYFRTTPSSAAEGSVLGKLVVADRNPTAVVMSRDDPYGNGLREATEKAIRESGGRILDSFHYDPNALDHDKEVQRVKVKNPDAIVLIGFTESARILAKMIEKGLGPRSKQVYGANMTNTLAGQVNPRDPSVLAGMKGALPDPGGEEFVKRLREANPGLRDLTYAAQAYDAVVITALAAAVAGTDEPAAVAKEIDGVTKTSEKCTNFAACMTLVKAHRDIDYDGPSGPLDFTDAGEPCSATYVINEIQTDGTVKPLRSVTVGC